MQAPKISLLRSVILFCLLLNGAVLQAQKTVNFRDIGFDEAVDKAKKEKKIVFVDVRNMNSNSYTDKVEKDVFTLDSVADFFNAHCVSIHMNMGTEEGKKFAPKLAMLMYPVYVFHGRNGDQLDFVNAGAIMKDPAVLMAKVRSSLAIDKEKNSNTRSITFAKGNWKTVLAKAKAANKLIFLDAQTTWCRPCIMMAKDIFTLDRIADYFNEHFINVTMDMEKGDGPALVKQYDVHAFPTFLFIDGDGKLVHRDGGYQEADPFLKVGKTAVGKLTGDTMPKTIPFVGMGGGSDAGASKVAAGGLKVADTGMRFADGTWASLLARARQNGKLIFLDANASWCGPCKQMKKEVFPQQAVAQLYNRNFINVDMDMEKGEGVDIKNKYGIKAYPTFLYINGEGEVVHKTLGSCDAASFRQHALDALSPCRNLKYLSSGYKDHALDEAFISSYLAALADAGEDKLADTAAVAYLQGVGPAVWQQPAMWQIIREYVQDATSAPFNTLVKEQAAYAKLFGAEAVDAKIYQTYLAWPGQYVTYPAVGKPVLDNAGFEAFLGLVKAGSYSKKEEIIGRARLTVYFGLRDWRSYAATVNQMLAQHAIAVDVKGADLVYSFADIINRFAGDDKAVLSDATRWSKLISEDVKGVNASNKATYLDLYATLLEKTGQNDMALQVRKEINQQQLTSAKNAAPFQTLIRIVPKQN